MFHHFHGGKHPIVQGSISGDNLQKMIEWLSIQNNLLSSSAYLRRLEQGVLQQGDISLSFDDALLCQAEIAVPILNKLDIQAFFFIYSSPFAGNPDPLEIYRYFRNVEFLHVDQFYSEFFQETETEFPDLVNANRKDYYSSSYLSEFSFYTKNDKWFRYLRDQVLGKERYDHVMNNLMIHHKFDRKKASSKLWMNNTHLENLRDSGHTVGLHSYSHPTMIHKMPVEQQEKEYTQNFEHLYSILGQRPIAMSHPCGNYSDQTLRILKKLGIKIGFRSSASLTSIRSPLEVPRDDHTNILKQMRILGRFLPEN